MSGFLESLVRRGAGLGAAPGEPTAALRPLSRFEQRPFEAANAETPPLIETDGVMPANARPHADRHAAAGEPNMIARASVTPGASLQGDRPLSEQTTARADTPPQHRAVKFSGSDTPFSPMQPEAATARIAPQVSAHDEAPAQPRDVRHTIPPAEPKADAAPENAMPDEPAPRVPRQSEGDPRDEPRPPSPNEPIVPPSPALRSYPIVTVHERITEKNERADRPDGVPAIPPPQHDPVQHQSEAPPAPQLTIAIGRIEIDFGQRPAPPPPAPGPQRTRGFDAYIRARRGRLR